MSAVILIATIATYTIRQVVLKSIDTSLRIDGDIDDCVASAFQLGEMGTEGIKLNAILLDGAFKQMEADGLIGNNFLAKFAVVIDFPAQRLLVKPF